MRKWTLCAACSALFLIGCTSGPGAYYPLEKGREWKYETTAQFKGAAPIKFEVTSFVMEKRTLQGREVVPVRSEIQGSTSFLFYGSDESGVYLVARQEATDPEPVAQPISYLVKAPVAKGTTWKSSLALRPGETPVVVECVVVGDDAAVSTDAGNFKNALQISCKGNVQQFGAQDTLVETHIWFVRGVGNVKNETLMTMNRIGAPPEFTITTVLESFKR